MPRPARREVSWPWVVFSLVCGATLFGCMAIEPVGSLALLVGAVFVVRWILNRGSDDE